MTRGSRSSAPAPPVMISTYSRSIVVDGTALDVAVAGTSWVVAGAGLEVDGAGTEGALLDVLCADGGARHATTAGKPTQRIRKRDGIRRARRSSVRVVTPVSRSSNIPTS